MDDTELERRFTYQSPKGDQAERYQLLRATALAYAKLIIKLTPASREQSLAITHLEDVVYCANAAIARNE